jgi:5'-3' exonuclease
METEDDSVNVHLVDGTYELFRHYFGAPPATDADGREVGAVIGVARSMLSLLKGGATHVGVATDHVVESFRNELFDGYKTGEGIEPELWAQFEPLEETLRALGLAVWAMVELEADDGMASAAARAAEDERVERIFLCTPDKDLGQSVRGQRVVQLDRRKGELRDAEGVRVKFGVPPESIPDYLALVGDAADGIPGIPGWGAKSTARVLARYGHLEAIPEAAESWDVPVRGAQRLAGALREGMDDAILYRKLATLREDAELFEDVDELRWLGPRPELESLAERLGTRSLYPEALRLAQGVDS